MNRMLQPLESLMGQVLRNTKCRTSCRQYAALGPLRRSFHNTRSTREAETSAEASIVNPEYWREFKEAYTHLGSRSLSLDTPNISRTTIGTEVTFLGFLEKVTTNSKHLCFATIRGASKRKSVQIVCRNELVERVKNMRLNSPVTVKGILTQRRKQIQDHHPQLKLQDLDISDTELVASTIHSLNTFPADIHVSTEHKFLPQDRHLQIRYDDELYYRLLFRAKVTRAIRNHLRNFLEIETPILFKSTPEGAREFLVPTRRPGLAYALPQSPQQYKQILMASGIHRYMQFARCFRDEDLRADRQPEFTQLDLEMAFTDGRGVMITVENLIRTIYAKCSKSEGNMAFIKSPLPEKPFLQMSYDEAMSKHGSDKPDLRIKPLIHRIDRILSNSLLSMLTSVEDPIVEACKFRLGGSSEEARNFIRRFLDSPEAEVFSKNPDGPPGVAVFDARRPLEGLQMFEFEGAENLKDFYRGLKRNPYEDGKPFAENTTFAEGDVLIVQARENLPHSGGSTMLGKLRLALHKAAVAEGLIAADPAHHYLWVTDFPMFTLNKSIGVGEGQGGSAGFSATHHPFTAPKSSHDVDLLLTSPLEAKADHYDLVVNGVELGGGSRRIHNVQMQKFVMREILKMSEERMNDFSHLFEALRAGCPPHAGFAIGFDRFIAVLTGVESIKDVIAFPKSSKGEDLMVHSPSQITDTELATYHLQFAEDFAPVKDASPSIKE